jgi:hypothetical protein
VCVKRQRNFIKTWEFVGVCERWKALLSPYFAAEEAAARGMGWGGGEGGCIAVSHYFHTVFPLCLLLSHPLVLSVLCLSLSN